MSNYDYFESLTPVQKKLIQVIKDIIDETNNGKRQEHFIFARKIPVTDSEQYQILANTMGKDKNNIVLGPYLNRDNTALDLTQFDNDVEEPEEPIAQVAEFDTIKSNNYTINEKLKYNKRITNIEAEIPKGGLIFYIKLINKFDAQTLGLSFKDGNICSYKFDIMFIREDNTIISEVKSKRNTGQTSLMEFYELENKIEGIDRIVFIIQSKHNPLNLADNNAKINDFLLSDTAVQEELVQSKMISFSTIENIQSNANYNNHPSLIKLRVGTNQLDYPTLYEFQSQNQYSNFERLNEQEIKVYNSVLKDNVFATTDKGCMLRIGNTDVAKYPDDYPTFSLNTLKKKGYIQYGGYKNRFIGMRFIPIEIDGPDYDISFVTRGGDIEDNNPNGFHAIVKMGPKEFTFSRQLIENKSDTFMEQVQPAFDFKIEPEQEIGITMYQFNINETDVQYFIYVKRHNDLDWILYNSFIDSSKLQGVNYMDQTIFWGGQYDYIFFNGIKKLKMQDLTVAELVNPIRKIE